MEALPVAPVWQFFLPGTLGWQPHFGCLHLCVLVADSKPTHSAHYTDQMEALPVAPVWQFFLPGTLGWQAARGKVLPTCALWRWAQLNSENKEGRLADSQPQIPASSPSLAVLSARHARMAAASATHQVVTQCARPGCRETRALGTAIRMPASSPSLAVLSARHARMAAASATHQVVTQCARPGCRETRALGTAIRMPLAAHRHKPVPYTTWKMKKSR